MRFYFLTKYKYSPKVGENGFVTVNVDIVFLIFIVLSGILIFQSTETAFFASGQYAFLTIIDFTIWANFSDIQELIP